MGVSGFFQTSEEIGGFESAAEEDIRGDTVPIEAAIDSDGDGLSDNLEETSTVRTNDPDTDNDGMETGEVQHGLNPLDNGESKIPRSTRHKTMIPATPKSRTKPSRGRTPVRVPTGPPTATG